MPVPLDKGDVDSGYEIRFTQVVESRMKTERGNYNVQDQEGD